VIADQMETHEHPFGGVLRGEKRMEKRTVERGIGSPVTAKKLLDMYFLETRSALLEAAAALDRIERAQGGTEIMESPMVRKLLHACDILKNKGPNRAEQFQILFSDPPQADRVGKEG
jgi:hypothetical protein